MAAGQGRGGASQAVIVGAGHNGLVAANYLADAGLAVTVLERREIVGGACVTEEVIPGFRASSCAFVAGPGLERRILRDLELRRYGLELYQCDPLAASIDRNGRAFLIHRRIDRTLAAIEARFGRDEAARFVRFGARLQRVANAVRPALLADPPSYAELREAFVRRGDGALFEAFFSGSVADLLDAHLEAEELKGFFTFLALTSVYGGPSSPGTAYVYTHHAWGEFEGRFGEFGYARGGMGAISEALAARARARGVEIRTGAAVAAITVAAGRVTGVRLEDGEELPAAIVLSNADPKRTFLDLVPAAELDPGFLDRVRDLDFRGTMARVHIAVDRLPQFAGFPPGEQGPHRALTILGADSGASERAFAAQQRGEMIDDPPLEMTIQSVHDDSLAPPGQHIITAGIQQLPFELASGSWEQAGERLVGQAVATISDYAPGFEASVLGARAITPLDLERDYALTAGNIFHGAMVPGQLFRDRPLAGFGSYRSPIAGLYMCGAGAHPGGGVTGAPGHNCARAVLADRGLPFAGATARWDAGRRRGRVHDGLGRLLERPSMQRPVLALARSRWLRPLADRVRSSS
ncbi:MAG: NAD(P)/FAD-dependent oxidoreductase [Actinobacteria bacterium]|nr:NAD(P)/FAD-dependent oxidoreductase [Actinomycetota bacterium]